MWRTTFTNTIPTSLPSDVDPESVIKLLHDHSFLTSTSPLVVKIDAQPPDPETGKQTLTVREDIDILPFGLWKRPIIFTADYQDTATGLLTWVHAPMNLELHAMYTVRQAELEDDGEGGEAAGGVGWELVEVAETTCNVVLKWFVQSTFVPVHRRTHEVVIAKAREVGRGVES